jgi:glutaredoxin
LGGINYPLLSDFWPHGAVSQQYGVLRNAGYTERAIFIIDKDGIIQYIDIHDIADQPSNDVLLEELRRIDPEAAANEPDEPETVELPHGGIVMYCTKWCTDCKKARAWFAQHNLEYTEVDISSTPGAADQVRQWADGKLVTPTLDIDGKIVINPDQAELEELFL